MNIGDKYASFASGTFETKAKMLVNQRDTW